MHRWTGVITMVLFRWQTSRVRFSSDQLVNDLGSVIDPLVGIPPRGRAFHTERCRFDRPRSCEESVIRSLQRVIVGNRGDAGKSSPVFFRKG